MLTLDNSPGLQRSFLFLELCKDRKDFCQYKPSCEEEVIKQQCPRHCGMCVPGYADSEDGNIPTLGNGSLEDVEGDQDTGRRTKGNLRLVYRQLTPSYFINIINPR